VPDDGLPPWRFIAAALDAGALTPGDILDHGVLVDIVGRSHPVYRVTTGGAVRFFAKVFAASRGATDGQAARERAVLALAADRAGVAALVPPPWPWRETRGGPWCVVATAAVPGAEAWTLDTAGGGTYAVDAAWRMLIRALVPPLARLHRDTRDLARDGAAYPAALAPGPPWGLRLMDGDAPPEVWTTPALATLLREAATDPVLVARLREGRALWRPLALTHADLKHDNVVVALTPEGWRVRVLDWEMARLGDPAWDLATLTTRLVVLGGDAPPWPDANVAAAAALLAAYADASGLPVPALARRLAVYTGAVLLMLSLQHASTLPPGGSLHDARTLVTKSRATMAGIDGLTAALIATAERGPA
jgi:hypothetical protein